MKRRRSAYTVAALLMVTVLAPLGPIGPMSSARADHTDETSIDFGLIFGRSGIETMTVFAGATDSAIISVNVPAPFEVARDLCTGNTLEPGRSCEVLLRIPDGTTLGEHTAIATVEMSGQPDQQFTLTAVVALGAVAAQWFALDEPRIFDSESATLAFSGTANRVTLEAEAGFDRVSISFDSIEPLTPGRHVAAAAATPGRDNRLSWSGDGGACTGGVLYIDRFVVDGDVLVEFAGSVSACSGDNKAVGAFTRHPSTMWAGPATDLGVTSGQDSVITGAVNLGPNPITVTTAAVSGHLSGDVSSCRITLAPGEMCAAELNLRGDRQGEPLAGSLVLDTTVGAIEAPFVGSQALDRMVLIQHSGSRGVLNYWADSRSKDLHPRVDFFGSVFFGNAGADDHQVAIDMTIARRGPGEYRVLPSGPTAEDGLVVRTPRECPDQSGTIVVLEADWNEIGGIDRYLAVFSVLCPNAPPLLGLVSHNADLGAGLIAPDWSEASFGVFDPTTNRRALELTNIGARPAPIRLRVTRNDGAAFYIGDGTCQSTVLDPGESCSQQITFAPIAGSDDPLVGVIDIDGSHVFSGMQVVMSGWAPPSWPVGDEPSSPPESGYWLLHADGSLTGFGDARVNDQFTDLEQAVKVAATPTGRGYWVLGSDGEIRAGGDAVHHGEVDARMRESMRPGERIVTLSPTPTGAGYWVFTSVGRAFRFGDAADLGDLADIQLAGEIIDSVASSNGTGVFMIATDGGVFALGDAQFAGSIPQVLPGVPLDEPIVGIVPDPDGDGYWLVAADGGVFAFAAGFRGSIPSVLAPGTALVQPVNGIVPYGDGYLLVASDGGVFNFSSLSFEGSLGGTALTSPVVAISPVR